MAFRGHNAAASLKLVGTGANETADPTFPRPQRRGLIEAPMIHRDPVPSPEAFRGHNAAASLKRYGHSGICRRSSPFRGHNAAASLKPEDTAFCERCFQTFRGHNAAASLKQAWKGMGHHVLAPLSAAT